jgi:hypothetical protein
VTTADLARAAAAREVARLAAMKVSEDQLGEVARRNGWLKLQMESLSDPEERVEACRRLVAWLSEQTEGE